MNPMVDMAFLLLSFFMMTTTFKADVPLDIEIPYSQSQDKLTETDIGIISIGKDGKIFFGLDNTFDRQRILKRIGQQNGILIRKDQLNRFSVIPSFGVPLKELKDYLSIDKIERKSYPQKGIPAEHSNNELKQWIIAARVSNPKLRFAIHADQTVPYPIVARCIETFRELNINRFSLITEIEVDDSTS